jgi:hypothetical protein
LLQPINQGRFLESNYQLLNLLLNPKNPTNPELKSSSAPGMGTGVATMLSMAPEPTK